MATVEEVKTKTDSLRESEKNDHPRVKWVEAVLKFKKELGPLVKKDEVKFGATRYNFMPLGKLLGVIEPLLAKHDLFVLQPLSFEEGVHFLDTELHHKGGWCKSHRISLPEPGDRKYQEYGSAISYLRRYSITSFLGLGFCSPDDDMRSERAFFPPQGEAPAERVMRPLSVVRKFLETHPSREEGLLAFYNVASVEEMTPDQLRGCLSMIKKGGKSATGTTGGNSSPSGNPQRK
ncbi:MAG: ERF family protein [Simkaniaceae bacterium]|nr:ERF family protein [Simkaniaceae bacterium]